MFRDELINSIHEKDRQIQDLDANYTNFLEEIQRNNENYEQLRKEKAKLEFEVVSLKNQVQGKESKIRILSKAEAPSKLI